MIEAKSRTKPLTYLLLQKIEDGIKKNRKKMDMLLFIRKMRNMVTMYSVNHSIHIDVGVNRRREERHIWRWEAHMSKVGKEGTRGK